MFRPHLLIAICLLVTPHAATPARFAPSATLPGPVLARVLRVIDGDTLVVRANIWLDQTVETPVRLLGVDAPELQGQCPRERQMARAARDFLARRLAGGTARLTDLRHDKYGGRVLARVAAADGAGGEDLSRALIARGLARPYDGGARSSWCA